MESTTNPVWSENDDRGRSEEHTSELQSPCNLVCRLLLEKKNCQALLPHGSQRVCADDQRGRQRIPILRRDLAEVVRHPCQVQDARPFLPSPQEENADKDR